MRFRHDCDDCVPLGTSGAADLYIHPAENHGAEPRSVYFVGDRVRVRHPRLKVPLLTGTVVAVSADPMRVAAMTVAGPVFRVQADDDRFGALSSWHEAPTLELAPGHATLFARTGNGCHDFIAGDGRSVDDRLIEAAYRAVELAFATSAEVSLAPRGGSAMPRSP